MDDLPHNLKIELSLYLHEETYKMMGFLKDKSMSFITWICPLLKPYYLESTEYLYFEGDEIHSIYFLKVGNCGFVLPKYDNAKYINLKPGTNFGVEDIIGSIIKNDEVTDDDWMSHKDKLLRQFTIYGESDRQMYLALSITDINRMALEFAEVYSLLFD